MVNCPSIDLTSMTDAASVLFAAIAIYYACKFVVRLFRAA